MTCNKVDTRSFCIFEIQVLYNIPRSWWQMLETKCGGDKTDMLTKDLGVTNIQDATFADQHYCSPFGLDGEQAIPILSFSTSMADFRWTSDKRNDKRNKIEKYYIKNASSNVYRCMVWVFGATIWYFLGGVVLLQHQTFPSSTVISSRNSSSNIEWSIVWYLIIEKSNNCTIIKIFMKS